MESQGNRRCAPTMVAAILMTLAAGFPAPAQTYSVVYTFTGGADGANPLAGLIPDSMGNLYGTTYEGGLTGCFDELGCGVVFKLDPAGNETVLYSFTGGVDGATPFAGVIRDAMGNLYGMTDQGGDIGGNCAPGCGVVFKLDPAGHETVLHSFTGGADGAYPYAGGLIRDTSGNLYGTTEFGGTPDQGVVFKLDAAGNETVLHAFTGGADGGNPLAGLIRDAAGNLYGTTISGSYGCGVVFKLDAAGHETVLHSFTCRADGQEPVAGLIRDAAGNLYGTTVVGGSGHEGVVFKLDPTGNETVLHSFTGGADGGNPSADLIRDGVGNLYGTTTSGGDLSGCGGSGCGVVFRLDPAGNERVLHVFSGGADGLQPSAPLLPYKGALYGTAGGGSYQYGVVFKLSVP